MLKRFMQVGPRQKAMAIAWKQSRPITQKARQLRSCATFFDFIPLEGANHAHPKSHSPSTTFTNLQPQMAQKHSILGKLHAVYPAPRHACGAAVKSAAMGGIASSKLPPVNDKDLRTPGHVCR